ncbi:GntR family transcriptional regulator [Flavobacterium sp. ASW18X]|uniref:GntR family transcriptional regulator n=1 Tax=Flavobacterium sp. ASW18X TaxID=2572595 RepID=UPI0010ADD2C6|nr:GntR family transcriptional regulator [Flavobacterium sp. ASW18X]TKD57918.1 GntR family transcriptional regulator [Flavobacterium sp. ASW18X]
MVDITLESDSKKPKYLRLAEAITKQIQDGKLGMNQKLPSVNKLSKEFSFSRETVFKALAYLSEKGIVRAVDKIGYFVTDVVAEQEYSIFLLLDKFTPFKEDLYNSMRLKLGSKAKVDLFFHHQNPQVFANLIAQNAKNYSHFVITTYLDDAKLLKETLKKLPEEKVILIDKQESSASKDSGMIFQDFQNDIYNALKDNLELVQKYQRYILITHENAPHAPFITSGFKKFCKDYQLKSEIHHRVDPVAFEAGNLYITIDAYDRDLVDIIKLTRSNGWQLGNQVGLISYNDTTTKEVLDGGITVISTDFKKMGVDTANMILTGKMEQKPNTTNVILRNSL